MVRKIFCQHCGFEHGDDVLHIDEEQQYRQRTEYLLRKFLEREVGREHTVEVKTAEAVDKFLASKRGAVSEYTVANYTSMLGKFAAMFPVLPQTPEEIERFLSTFKSRSSANTAYAVLLVFYKFAEQRFGARNVVALVKRPKVKPKEADYLTKGQARALLDAVETPLERGLIYLYLAEGLRLREALNLNVEDVFEDRLRIKGKEAEQFMPLLPEVREVLLPLCKGKKPSDPVFTLVKGKRIAGTTAEEIVRKVFDRAGIRGIRASPHTLRHTFATLLTQAGCNDYIVTRLLRHEAPKTVNYGYRHVSFDDLQHALQKFSVWSIIGLRLNYMPKTANYIGNQQHFTL